MADPAIIRLPGIACRIDHVAVAAPGSQLVVDVAPGHGAPAQTAPYARCIMVAAGAINLTIGDGAERLGPGASRRIAAGQVHGFSVPGPGPARLLISAAAPAQAALVRALAALPPGAAWADVAALFRRHGHRLIYD